MDGYIRQSLKNWASEHQAQPNGRARLLLVAASNQRQQTAGKLLQEKGKEVVINRTSPVDQAMGIYNLPWLWVAHISLTPIRSVT